MATMADVARLAGVSVKTVSNVLNDYPYIRAETRDKVLAAVAELGYQVNHTARSLRSGRTGMIGLAVPELGQPYFGQLADEVLAAGRRHDVQVIIEPTGYSREGEIAALREITRRPVDGLLLSPAMLTQEDAALLEQVELPLVLLGEQIFNPKVDHVTMRNEEGARAATELLLSRGRRRIAVIGLLHKLGAGASDLRFEAYRSVLEEHGIEPDPRLFGWSDEGWHRGHGARAMAAILDSGVEVDGVFAFNDALALGAMSELQARGITVPGDVAVVGFDNIEDAAFSQPTLTTIDAGRREIAETAVDLLCRRIEERAAARAGRAVEPAPPVLHLAELEIVERESTPPRPR